MAHAARRGLHASIYHTYVAVQVARWGKHWELYQLGLSRRHCRRGSRMQLGEAAAAFALAANGSPTGLS